MKRVFSRTLFLTVALMTGVVLSYSGQADAMKYMGLKDAIKHYLPADATLSKVNKTLSAGQASALKKKYGLKDSSDFKDTLKPGNYTVYIGRGADKKAKIYIFILEQYWRTCFHKYVVGVTPDGKIKEVNVMDLPCKYQRPIAKKSFLKQFDGKNGKTAQLGKGIDAVTGATASCEATTIVARRALALHEAFFSGE
jgi:hypothetical protein